MKLNYQAHYEKLRNQRRYFPFRNGAAKNKNPGPVLSRFAHAVTLQQFVKNEL